MDHRATGTGLPSSWYHTGNQTGPDHKPISPLARLLGIIRPEKNDLWIVLIFSIVVGVLALASPVAVEALVNTVAFGRYLQPVVILAALLFTFLTFAAAIRGLIAFIVEIIQRRLFIRVVEDLAYRLPRARHDQFDQRHGPELVNRFFDVVTVQKAASGLLLDGIAIVNIRGASYAYSGKKVIDGCNLRLDAGESVALTGPAGSGKSSLIDLLCGLRTPTSGHVELDDIDVRELRPDSLREHLALSRSIEIFNGSIDENVHLGRPNVRASDVRDALEAVGLLDEVLQLPDGLNSMLQTNGAPLTQGQATRLMLARAIVGRPRLLLVDGTLDGLPDETAKTIAKRLTAAKAPWTLLVASGRKCVIDTCDRVHSLQSDSTKALSGDKARSQIEFNDITS